MSRLTWIIIVLIAVSILVTCTEVFLRFGLIAKGHLGEIGNITDLTTFGEMREMGVKLGVVEGGMCVCRADGGGRRGLLGLLGLGLSRL